MCHWFLIDRWWIMSAWWLFIQQSRGCLFPTYWRPHPTLDQVHDVLVQVHALLSKEEEVSRISTSTCTFSFKRRSEPSQVVLLCCLALYWIGLIDLIMYITLEVFHVALGRMQCVFQYCDWRTHSWWEELGMSCSKLLLHSGRFLV